MRAYRNRRKHEIKRILIVGAGFYQHYIFHTARRLGLWICCVDGNPNSPMFNRADHYAVIDFSDADAVVTYAKQQQVDAVASINIDQGMKHVAYIQRSLGFPALPDEIVRAATRKDLMREEWRRLAVRQPGFWVFSIDRAEQIVDLALSRPGELIIKPVDNAAKRGVAVLQGQKALDTALVNAAFANSACQSVIVEEIIDGTLIFATSFVEKDGTSSVLLMSQAVGQNFIQLRFDAPLSFGRQIDTIIVEEAIKAVRCFGPGAYHTEIIVAKSGLPYLIETAPRLSYATVALARIVAAFDPVQWVLEQSFQTSLGEPELPSRANIACLQHLWPQPGEVFHSAGINNVLGESVYEVVPLVPNGHVVQTFRTNADRVLYFVLSSDSLRDLEKERKRVEAQLLTDCFGRSTSRGNESDCI